MNPATNQRRRLLRWAIVWGVSATSIALWSSRAAVSAADNWPQWRGENLDSVSREAGVPVEWSRSENVAWRVALPGPAGSSPIVWGENIFLTSADDDDLVLLCIGTDGRERWRHQISTGNQVVRRGEGNSASPSPSTDGKYVWAMVGDGTLVCLTVDGQPHWKLDLQELYGEFDIQFGMTSTPVLDNGRLYLQLIHGDMRDESPSVGFVIALDAETGKQLWMHERRTEATVENKHSYASPTIYRDDAHEWLLVHGADYLTAHSLEDGSEVWRRGGFNPRASYNPLLRFVASPAWAPGLIVAPSAKQGPVLGFRPNAADDSLPEVAWEAVGQTPDVSTPLIHDGLVYLTREDGIITCLDAGNGDVLYSERLVANRHRSSPVWADGKVYVAGRDGTVAVIEAGHTFKVLARNELDEEITASPAIAGGRLYLRTFEALYAIGSPQP
jgi:outer membrane protein assembly factor BamB